MSQENYSDFGFTSNYKASTRYKLRDNLNIRSSVSTGFRAPSLQQINFSSTFTNVQGGLVSEVKIAPNYSALTKAAGIDELKQEVSTNFNIGMTWNPIREFKSVANAFRGYIDGINAETIDFALREISAKNIEKIFVDGSNFGGIVKVIKLRFPKLQAYTFFHNVEARFFWGSWRIHKTFHAFSGFSSNRSSFLCCFSSFKASSISLIIFK